MQKIAGLPNLIIAGVPKAGTTSLFMYLKRHPDVCASSRKETCYFLPLRYGNTKLQPIESYKAFFAGCTKEPVIMEATPGYFYGGKRVAQAIYGALGLVRILIVLREPISRLFSFYKSLKSRLILPRHESFEHYVEQCLQDPSPRFDSKTFDVFWGIEGGYYDLYLPDWLAVFKDTLRVVFFDDLMNQPEKCVKGICKWLNLATTPFDGFSPGVENRSVGYRNSQIHKLAITFNEWAEPFWRRYPGLKKLLREGYYRFNGQNLDESISQEMYEYLVGLYRPHNQALKKQLLAVGYTDLPAWLVEE